MNISIEELDGPTTYFSHYLNAQGSLRVPRSEMDPMSSRIQTLAEDSKMTLLEETKLPKIKSEISHEHPRQRRAIDKHGNIKSLFHKSKRQEEP